MTEHPAPGDYGFVDDDPPMICPATGEPCVRAFCDDYGCANNAGVPVDEYDVACGSLDPDELIPPIPRIGRERVAPLTEPTLFPDRLARRAAARGKGRAPLSRRLRE